MMRIVTLVPYKVIWKEGPNYGKDAVGTMSDNTVEFIQNGFTVFRNFIPTDIINFAMDTWKTIDCRHGGPEVFFDDEKEPIPDSPEATHHTSKGGHTTPMGVAMHRYLHKKLKNEFNMDLVETYAYTRKYERGAYLKAHADRPSCEVSATICLGYETDDGKPWRIWVDNSQNWVDIASDNKFQKQIFADTQGVPQRHRKSIPIDLEVGDLLLYQGPNVIHWRDYLLGNYSYHMFLHYITSSTSKLQYCATEEYPQMVGAHLNNTKAKRNVLTYDGRKTPYEASDENTLHHKEFQHWVKFWEHTDNKSDYVNNYDHLEFEKIEEK